MAANAKPHNTIVVNNALERAPPTGALARLVLLEAKSIIFIVLPKSILRKSFATEDPPHLAAPGTTLSGSPGSHPAPTPCAAPAARWNLPAPVPERRWRGCA